jgi:spore maturation protein CgeB
MKARPRIACFGSSLVSAYWNGAATYYRGIFRALAARGYAVEFYEPDAFDRQSKRDILDPPWARVSVYSGSDPAGALAALDRARSADILVKTSGVGVFDELLESAVLELRRPGQMIIFWDVDAPATLDRIETRDEDPFRRLVPSFDFIFTYGGGQPVVRRYLDLGARRCAPIYNALDPDTHHPVPASPRYDADLALLANRLPDREARVDEFFFRAAEFLPRRRLLLGGSGWESKPMPGNVQYTGHVYTADHNVFNASARAVLNVARDSMARNGFSPATRIFEAAGAGACIVTDAWQGIECFLEPGQEILVAENGAEVAGIVGGLDEERAWRIGEAARRRVLAEHTYSHRAAELEDLLDIGRPGHA